MNKKLDPITPGEILLEEFLLPMGINQSKLSEALNVPANRISQIINDKREISVDTALRLAKFFDIEPEFWLNLQIRYNLKLAHNEEWEKIADNIPVFKDIDVYSENRPNT